MWLRISSHEEAGSKSHPRVRAQFGDLLWPLGCGRCDAILCQFQTEALQLPLALLEPSCHQVSKPGLACWRMGDPWRRAKLQTQASAPLRWRSQIRCMCETGWVQNCLSYLETHELTVLSCGVGGGLLRSNSWLIGILIANVGDAVAISYTSSRRAVC